MLFTLCLGPARVLVLWPSGGLCDSDASVGRIIFSLASVVFLSFLFQVTRSCLSQPPNHFFFSLSLSLSSNQLVNQSIRLLPVDPVPSFFPTYEANKSATSLASNESWDSFVT